MTHNDLKKGDRVLCVPGAPGYRARIAVLTDSRPGIIRNIRCTEENGYYDEFGTIYVDEILAVEKSGGQLRDEKGREWEPLTISNAHRKKMREIRAVFPL